MTDTPPERTRVLVVDDSVIVRRVLTDALSRFPDIEVVGTARDPYEARDRIIELEPDVITLDIEMPRMDGLTFLEKLMATKPMRVVVVSSVAQASSANAIRAMSLGAVDVVPKPEGPTSVPDVERYLVRAIRTAASIPLARIRAPRRRVVPPPRTRRSEVPGSPSSRLIALGASTGGPPAIEQVITGLPEESPGMVVVQHMPAHFTRAFANRLDGLSALRVHEAEDGEVIRDGTVYIAPGGRHLQVRRCADGFLTQLKDGPPVHHQRPAVDVLFDSVAGITGADSVGVLLTGMGADGGRGMKALRDAGVWTIAQDEETCVVYGMPKEAVAMGGVSEILPLERIASAVARRLKPVAALATAALMMLACGGRPQSGPDVRGDAPGVSAREARSRANELRLEPFSSVDHAYRDGNSRLPHSVRLTVQDSAEWRAVWTRIVGPNATVEPPPVDFSREMLLVAGMGERPCRGYLINIDTVFQDDSRRIYALVRERHRGARCGCLSEVVSPVDVVRVPRTIRPVTFLERRETNVCEDR